MALAAPAKPKINTSPTQPGRDRAARRAPGKGKTVGRGRGPAHVTGDTRESVGDSARVVVEVECGILVYPPEEAGSRGGRPSPRTGGRGTRKAGPRGALPARLRKAPRRPRPGA